MGEFETVMQTRDEVEGRILPTPLVVISGYANTGKKFSIAFIKYFLKLIRQMKGILFIDFLIQKDFLNTRSRQ